MIFLCINFDYHFIRIDDLIKVAPEKREKSYQQAYADGSFIATSATPVFIIVILSTRTMSGIQDR